MTKIAVVVANFDYSRALVEVLKSFTGYEVHAVDLSCTASIKTIAQSILQIDPDLLFIDEDFAEGKTLYDVLYQCEIDLPPHHVRRWLIQHNPRVFRTTEKRNSLGLWSKYTFTQLHFLLQPNAKDSMRKILMGRIRLALEDLRK